MLSSSTATLAALVYVRIEVPARALQKKGHHNKRWWPGIDRELCYNPFLMFGAGLKPTVRLALMLMTSPV